MAKWTEINGITNCRVRIANRNIVVEILANVHKNHGV